MEENVKRASSAGGTNNGHLIAAANSLLENIADKDVQVRKAIEMALERMIEKRPNETVQSLYEYRQKHSKLTEQQVAIILRVIESNVTNPLATTPNAHTIDNMIEMSINELIRSQDPSPFVHRPAVECLIAIGRTATETVMQHLLKQLKAGQVSHYMILHSMGSVATVNISGIIPTIKPILEIILPTLGMIKHDHIKQSYAFAIGRFAEAITEELSDTETVNKSENYQTEMAVAYEVFLHQWLPNRDPQVTIDILQSLAHIYPLLSRDKIEEQSPKVISQLLNFYRRSIDRNAITQLMTSVIKSTIRENRTVMDPLSDQLIVNLFDLICVQPDYEKPLTVKGHYEVLRCFDLLLDIYSIKILDMLLIQMRSNNERDRIKSLLIITHLWNTSDHIIGDRIKEFQPLLKFMIINEKTIKLKLVLLKTIVALAQKAQMIDHDFVRFIVRNCLQPAKINNEHGTIEEHIDFVQACNNSLFLMATTVDCVSELLKRELLQYYVSFDYTELCGTIAKCLETLYGKEQPTIVDDPTGNPFENVPDDKTADDKIPAPETILIRSLILLGNRVEKKRTENILSFLRNYSTIVDRSLIDLWPELIAELKTIDDDEEFYQRVYEFIIKTIDRIDDIQFVETLINRTADQHLLYPIVVPFGEFLAPKMSAERGMMLKILGIVLCYTADQQTVDAKLDLIISLAQQDRIDKNQPDHDHKLIAASQAIGFVSRAHLDAVLKRLEQFQSTITRKTSGNFFTNLIKDTQRDAEIYKVTLLTVMSYNQIVKNAPLSLPNLRELDERCIQYLHHQLVTNAKDQTMKKIILTTLLTIIQHIVKSKDTVDNLFDTKSVLFEQLLIIESTPDNLPLLPLVLQVATALISIQSDQNDHDLIQQFFEDSCKRFFTCAQKLRTKFESVEEDDQNSLMAKYLNNSLPELNGLVQAIFIKSPSPATLDDVNCVFDYWLRDGNSEVRICAGHVMNSALDVYLKTMKLGCEAPSKFNQTGQMLGRIIPRCIDSNATVRQISIDILRKILEIACVYDTLTVATDADWIIDLRSIHEKIVTDDSKEIYTIAGDLARIIALRLSNLQYLQFSKTLMNSLTDPEESSTIGACVVLKFFVEVKGSEMFHNIPVLIREMYLAIDATRYEKAKQALYKSLIALTKHHPKAVCTDMLTQSMPFSETVCEYWKLLAAQPDLCGIIIDNFLNLLASSCLYEAGSDGNGIGQLIASIQPFSIFCSMREMFGVTDLVGELKVRFPQLFAMLLISLATYTNLAPPMINRPPSQTTSDKSSSKNIFGFIPNKEIIKMNPSLIVLDALKSFLQTLGMEQILAVLNIYPQLANSTNLNNFMDLLTPLATALVNELGGIQSSPIKQLVIQLNKYISSPYDSQRIVAIGLYSQFVPLKPFGDCSSTICLHLNSSLSDPNPLVRGFCIRGLSYVGHLTDHDVEKYSEIALAALLKGIDDSNPNCFINIPLESMRGLSNILMVLPQTEQTESFHVSLAIRIRPFFENGSADIRAAAILLFGDLCQTKISKSIVMNGDTDHSSTADVIISEALKEQLFANFISLLLHLSEVDTMIVKACKLTLRKVCPLIGAPKINKMVQDHLLDYGHLHYDIFIMDFMKLISIELMDHIPDFVESSLPFLKSTWPEIRGNATIIIGVLHNLSETNNQSQGVSQKITTLLRDEQNSVRIKAAFALGYIFGDLV